MRASARLTSPTAKIFAMRVFCSLCVGVVLLSAWASAEVGGIRLRVADRGRAVPGAIATISAEELEGMSSISDVTGLAKLTAEAGNYNLHVRSAGGDNQAKIRIRGGGFDSYMLDETSGTIRQLDDPLPRFYTPPNVAAEEGYGLAYGADNGLVTIDLTTPYGPVYLSAPELSAPNTGTSWGVLPSPTGADEKALKRSQKEMERHSIAIGTETLSLGSEGVISVRSATEVVLRVSRGKKEVVMGTIQLLVVEMGDETLVKRREQQMRMVIGGEGFTYYGRFDGNAGNTAIMNGSEPIRVAAESTYGTSFYTPTTLRGVSEVGIIEDGMRLTARFRNIGLEFVADKYDLIRGESTTSHVTLHGLAGIAQSAFLGLVNTTPGVITFMPQNTQLITVLPGDVAADGTTKFDRGLTGIQRGNFRITAILMVP